MRSPRQVCHVKVFPNDEAKIAIWIMILELKRQGWGIKRIAQRLNSLEIPSPGAGTVRTDHGCKHEVTGKWCQNTVAELCRNRPSSAFRTRAGAPKGLIAVSARRGHGHSAIKTVARMANPK